MIGLTTILFAFIIVIITLAMWFSLNHDHRRMVFVLLKKRFLSTSLDLEQHSLLS